MFGLLSSKEPSFFDNFRGICDNFCEGARELMQLLLAPEGEREGYCQRIKAMEHAADELTRRCTTQLQKAFITPLDQGDILNLVNRLDDIMDFLNTSAQRITLYQIGVTPPAMLQMASLNIVTVDHVRQAVAGLEQLKHQEPLLKLCVEINRLENEADVILRASVAALFNAEPDMRQLIKLKEIYELLETVSDRCEDVANVIESLALGYS